MEQGKITCPKCGQEFELTDALTGRIRAHLEAELAEEVVRREAEVKKKGRDLKKLEAQLADSRKELEDEIELRLKARMAEAEKNATEKLEGKYADQLKELKEDLAQKAAAIKTFREQELELRKRQKKLEEAKESLELDVARKLEQEREKIREAVLKKTAEEHRLKDLEKEKVINDLRASLEDMKRKAEQGGFRLISAHTTDRDDVGGKIKRDGETHNLKLAAVQFDGLLQVTDPQRLRRTVRRGIGSGKGLGFGLLSLAPPP